MSKKTRLDVLLVTRGLQESRQKAQATIMSGLVYVNGQKADKPGTPVAEDAQVEIRGGALRYVSRGGLKLEKAMALWPIRLTGKVCMDVGASTGGTDILAMILKKFTSLDIGMALLYVDVLIAGSTLILIDIETGLFSLLGLVLKSVLVDSVIESLNRKKSFILVTSCPEEVCDFITHTLHRSATFWKGEGAYSHQDKWVVLTALSRAQAVALRRHLKSIDPHAFMLITNSSEIFGKGFLRA